MVDPEIPLDATLIPSRSPRPKNPVFDDEKRSKVKRIILGSDYGSDYVNAGTCSLTARKAYFVINA